MVNVKVVYGAPLSGKTTHVKERLTKNDIVYDYDDLMQVLTGLPYQQHNPNVESYIKDFRELILAKLKRDTNLNNAYIITTFLSDNLKQELSGLDVEYIKMNT